MQDLLTRRRFLQALAASVVAVGAPLPIGFPEEPLEPLPPGTYSMQLVGVETGRWSGRHVNMTLHMRVAGRILEPDFGDTVQVNGESYQVISTTLRSS